MYIQNYEYQSSRFISKKRYNSSGRAFTTKCFRDAVEQNKIVAVPSSVRKIEVMNHFGRYLCVSQKVYLLNKSCKLITLAIADGGSLKCEEEFIQRCMKSISEASQQLNQVQRHVWYLNVSHALKLQPVKGQKSCCIFCRNIQCIVFHPTFLLEKRALQEYVG